MKKRFQEKSIHTCINFFKTFKRGVKISKKAQLEEYVENLKKLSKHNKLVRIDINGKPQKNSKYFFEKDKYVYVKNKDQIEALAQQGEKKGNVTGQVITTTKKKEGRERKRNETDKKFRNIYSLTQEEVIYMKFIYKIKIKNIFSLINNIKKNIYINEKQRKTILHCIYKYISYNCFSLSKKEFCFFVYLFPQYVENADKVIAYINRLLNSDITLEEVIQFITEINLIRINPFLKENYLDYLNTNIKKANILHILQLLTNGSYLFENLECDVEQKKADVFIKNIEYIVAENEFVLNEETKIKYLNFLLQYNNEENFFLKKLFDNIYMLLYKKIFLNNIFNHLNNHGQFFRRVLELANTNSLLISINSLLLQNSFFKKLNHNVKIKVFPYHIEKKERKSKIEKWNKEKRNALHKSDSVSNVKHTNASNLVSKEQNSFHFPKNGNDQIGSALGDKREISVFEKKHKQFCFIYPMDKMNNTIYEEAKEKYKIPTKITDKNIKIFLKFLKGSHYSRNDYIDEIFNKKNIFKIMADIRKTKIEQNEKVQTDMQLFQDLLEKWNYAKQQKEVDGYFHTMVTNSYFPISRNDSPKKKITEENRYLLECTHVEKNSRHYIKNSSDQQITDVLRCVNYKNKEKAMANTNNVAYANFANFTICGNGEYNDLTKLVHNICANSNLNNKFYYISQLNSLSKFLFFFSDFFYLVKKKDVTKNWKNIADAFIVMFSEMCTYVLKNIYMINAANYFYIFVALVKFIEISQMLFLEKAQGDTKESKEHTNVKKNADPRIILFYLIYLVREYEYTNVKNILHDPDNRSYILYKENKYTCNKKRKQLSDVNFEKIHKNILDYFTPNSIAINDSFHQRHKLEKAIFGNKKNEENIDSLNQEHGGSISWTVKKEDGSIEKSKSNENLIKNICINSYHYMVLILNNYLDFSKFHVFKFLISLFYLNQLMPHYLKTVSHLEWAMKRNQELYMKKYFFIFNGINEEEHTFLTKKNYIYIVQTWKKKEHEKNKESVIKDFYLSDISSQWKCNIYDVIESVFQKRKKKFSFSDTLNFLFIYSMNGLYKSNIFYTISKFIYNKIDITMIGYREKTFLFFLFYHCKNCYRPFWFSLLSEFLKIDELCKLSERNNLYTLCALLVILIKNSKMKKKRKRFSGRTYIESKFGKYDFSYFFPLEMFYQKNVFSHIKKKIAKMEKNIMLKKQPEMNYMLGEEIETINVNRQFILNFQYLEKDFMRVIPLLLEKCKIYFHESKEDSKEERRFEEYEEEQKEQRVVAEKEKNSGTEQMLYFYFDKPSEMEIFENVIKFLTYEWVVTNFQISKQSIYHKLLLHLQALKR